VHVHGPEPWRAGPVPNLRATTMTRYYSSGDLDKMIDDLTVPIWDVIKEVERVVRGEFHAAAYYRDHPELLFPGHPWLRFIGSGEAPLCFGFLEDWPVDVTPHQG
jgi:hypothetical protein